jgi:hypothetical protein
LGLLLSLDGEIENTVHLLSVWSEVAEMKSDSELGLGAFLHSAEQSAELVIAGFLIPRGTLFHGL